MFQAITMDGSSQLSFDSSRYDITYDDRFVFIKSLKTGQVKGTSFANLQCFTPEFPKAMEILKTVKKSHQVPIEILEKNDSKASETTTHCKA